MMPVPRSLPFLTLALCALFHSARPLPGAPDPVKSAAFSWIDAQSASFAALNRFIWEAAEVGLEETQSSAALMVKLAAADFQIEKDVAGMPTAFVARYGSGKPAVAILAEYDALPGMSQKAEPHPAPRVAGGAGHACGHSAFGTASVAAALAVRRVMEEHGLPGTVLLYGTPAEETGIGKSYMVKEGAFAPCDVALHWHPGYANQVSFSRSKAVVSVKYTFEGLPAHASLSPHDGLSALDAVELTNVGANFLREHVKEDSRIHYVITDGGGQPNVVPPRAQVWYYLRADRHEDVEHLFARMEKVARGAALMTDTKLSLEIQSDAYELLPNRPLSEAIQRNLELAGAPSFTEEEKAFARKTQEPLVLLRGKEFEKPLDDRVAPLSAEPDLIKASTDAGNVSWVVPSGGFRTACYTWEAPGHSWQVVACTGMSIGEKGMLAAAKVLAGTAIDLLRDPALVESARKDFGERKEGRTIKSLIPEAQRAPVKIR
jgi:aminobenzoyl-glutamate utilization protein B